MKAFQKDLNRQVDAYLAKQSQKQAKQASRGWLLVIVAAVVTATLILVAINYPAHYLAFLAILGSVVLSALLKLWLDCRADTRAYRDEHGL